MIRASSVPARSSPGGIRAAPSGPGRRSGGRPAFSLVELITVMTIIATVGAIAVPRYAASLNRYRAEAAARRVVADVDLARRAAVTGNAAVVVDFDPAGDEYVLEGVSAPGPPGTDYTVKLGVAPYRARITTVTYPENKLVFTAYGSVRTDDDKRLPEGAITVAAGDVTLAVVVDPDTGGATIQ